MVARERDAKTGRPAESVQDRATAWDLSATNDTEDDSVFQKKENQDSGGRNGNKGCACKKEERHECWWRSEHERKEQEKTATRDQSLFVCLWFLSMIMQQQSMRSRQYNQLEAENESLTKSRPAVRETNTPDLHRRLVSLSASFTTSNTTPFEDISSEKPSGR